MAFRKKQPDQGQRAPSRQVPTKGPVFSYHANRSVRAGTVARSNQEETPGNVSRKRRSWRQWLHRLTAITAFVVIALVALLSLRLTDNPKVVTMGAAGSNVFLRSRAVYEAAAKRSFASLFNGNKLTVNTSKIAADLQRQFPELKAVSVSLPFVGTQPVVYVQPSTPRLLLANSSGAYVLDGNGRALVNSTQVPNIDALHVPAVTDQSNLKTELGQVALPKDVVSYITEVVGQLQAKGVGVTQLVLPAGTTELQVHMNGVGYYVRYNLHGNAREEAGAYLATKQYLDGRHITPGSYIDVRVENKVYYR